MSLILNTEPCSVCHIEQVPYGRLGPTGSKKCIKCKNKEQAENRRITQWKRRSQQFHFCIYCHNNIGTQKTKYCNRKCQQLSEQLNRARKKVKSLKDKMLYQRRVNTYQRKRVYVLNNYDKVAATKAAWKIKHKVKRSGMLDQVLKDDI